MHDEYVEPFERLIEQRWSPAASRRAERADGDTELWAALATSGFLDALVPDTAGGVGLIPADVAPLFMAAGRHLLPSAFSTTIVARALAAAADCPLNIDGPILLYPLDVTGRPRSLLTPVRDGALHALVQQGTSTRIVPVRAQGDDGFGFIAAALDLDAPCSQAFDLTEDTAFVWAATVTLAEMAGAMNAVLRLSITHVNERQQFGRALAKFQAIQHQISVMAEWVAMANVAV